MMDGRVKERDEGEDKRNSLECLGATTWCKFIICGRDSQLLPWLSSTTFNYGKCRDALAYTFISSVARNAINLITLLISIIFLNSKIITEPRSLTRYLARGPRVQNKLAETIILTSITSNEYLSTLLSLCPLLRKRIY